jgi:hypothetical protein
MKNNNNYKIITCDVCDISLQIDVETQEISTETPINCNCIDCPYSGFDREGGDPEPLRF